jgi:murein DD-endopeptidase MepM/ murein hydrolase activator NlpD
MENGEKTHKGYGRNIIIQHDNGFYTRYGQLDTCLVQNNSRVKQGDFIGRTGQSGISTGPHLHFELIVEENYQDPARYID